MPAIIQLSPLSVLHHRYQNQKLKGTKQRKDIFAPGSLTGQGSHPTSTVQLSSHGSSKDTEAAHKGLLSKSKPNNRHSTIP